jgi:uncharacterized sodium:solute symporter family permease YidK
MHEFHFRFGVVQLADHPDAGGEIKPRKTEFSTEDVGAVDATHWRLAKPVGVLLIGIVFNDLHRAGRLFFFPLSGQRS